MPSDHFEEGVTHMEKGDARSALDRFRFIVDNHPRNALYPRALYNLAYCHYQLGEHDDARDILLRILGGGFDEKEGLGGDIMGDPYANYRHRASYMLHNIHYDAGRYDSSLHYLSLSDTVHSYLHFCGNAYDAHDVHMALRYADIHERMNDPASMKRVLLQAAFNYLSSNGEVIERLRDILIAEGHERGALLVELEQAIGNIQERMTFVDGKERVTGHTILFQGVEVPVPGAMAERLKDSDFFNMIAEL